MNKYTKEHIEEKLRTLASIEPTEESVRQMNQSVRRIIIGSSSKPTTRSFFYYAAASAAMLLIGISILYNSNPIVTPPTISSYAQTNSRPTLAKLNAVIDAGGQQGLDDYFEMVDSNRQPRAETITLQQIMKEL